MARSTAARTETAEKDGYHHGDLRRALLDATLMLVEKHGPQGFTLRAAARAAGVTAGAPYHHFEDKDALLTAVAAEGFELFRRALENAARKPVSSPTERMRNLGTAYVLFAIEQPTRFRIMVGYGMRRQTRHGAIAATARASYQFIRDVLVKGLDADGSDPVGEAEVLGWWSIVHGLAFLAIDGHLGKVGRSPERADAVVRAVLEALDRREHARRSRSCEA
jgi:AcrR family transcriptional regulator